MASNELKTIRTLIESQKQLNIQTNPTIEERRQNMEAMQAQWPLAPDTKLTPVDAKGVKGEWIKCGRVDSHKALLYFHGGGYIMGSVATHRELCSRLSQAIKIPVLSINYRLAPEHPYPAAVNDAISAYKFLLDEGFNPKNIVVSGDSAGGGLALSLLLKLKERKGPLPSCSVVLCHGGAYVNVKVLL